MSTTGSEDRSFSPNNSTSSSTDESKQFNSSDSTDSSENGPKKKLKRNYRRMENKPPFSYQALIIAAIQTSDHNKMTLREIFSFLEKSFSFFRGEYRGWRDSIRHNLTSSPVFEKVLKDPKKPTKKSNFWRVRYEKVSCIVMRDIAAIQYHLRGVTGSMEMAPLHPSTRLGSFAGMEGVSSSKVEGFYGHQGMMTSSPVIDVGTSGAEGEGIAASAGSAARSTKDYRDNKKFKKNPKNGKAFLMESILKTPFQEKEQIYTVSWPAPVYYSTPISPMKWIGSSTETPSSSHSKEAKVPRNVQCREERATAEGGIGAVGGGGGILPFSPGNIYPPNIRLFDSTFARFLNQQNSYGFQSPASFICGHNYSISEGLDNLGSSNLEQQTLLNQFGASLKSEKTPGITPLYNPIDCLENMNFKYSM